LFPPETDAAFDPFAVAMWSVSDRGDDRRFTHAAAAMSTFKSPC
jgi:hypothetical protein